MRFNEILSLESTLSAVQCSSKKKALEMISELAASSLNLPSQDIFEILLAREKMGSTAIGNGIAVPHGKLEGEGAKVVAFFLQLEEPIDFEANDNQPVDLLFALFVPEKECQTKKAILSLVAQYLLDKNIARQLRTATSNQELYQILINCQIELTPKDN